MDVATKCSKCGGFVPSRPPWPLEPGDIISVLETPTLRDQFAMVSLTGLVVNGGTCSVDVPITIRAYELADAMLEARKQ